jgi:hypothetical protein
MADREEGAARGRRSATVRAGLLIVLLVLAAFLSAGLYAGARAAIGRFRPFEKDVTEKVVVYFEGMKPAGKLVILEGLQRFTASKEFTAKVLAVLKLDARIELSAMADTAWFVDLSDPKRWKASWNPRSRTLRLRAPAPDLLPPAIRTETIEVRTEGATLVNTIVFRLKKETEAMKTGLSADVLAQGRAALSSEEIQARLRSGLEGFAKAFCSSALGLEPRAVEVVFDAAPGR